MKKKPPWVWIAVCSVLVVAVAGLGVWGLTLRGDLDDANAQAAQTSAQVSAESDELSARIDDLATAVADTSERLDQAIEDAGATVSQKAADGDVVREKAADART